MKGFAKIALTVALIAVIVLSIIVASVAWFTSNPEVDANDVTLDAARTLIVTFDRETSSGYAYNGEIGNVYSTDRQNPDPDEPYVYGGGGFHINISPSGDGKYGTIKVEFGTVTVSSPAGGSVFNVLITDLFHITATIKEDGENKPTYDVTIGDDGYVSEVIGAPQNRYYVDNGVALFMEGGYTLSFTYTFLREEAYIAWATAVAAASTGTVTVSNAYGYERSGGGDYVGVVDYVQYKAKYHYGLQRYARSGSAEPYTYTPSENGSYVRVIDDYLTNVDKYDVTFTPSDSGDYYKDPYTETYISASNATDAEKTNGIRGSISSVASGTNCIKVGDSGDYVAFGTYNRINGFAYSNDRYRGEVFTFEVNCSVEEVTYEA